MNIADHIQVKVEFNEVPKECLIKTYLGSKVVIVHCGKHTSTTWDKHNTIKATPNIYLDVATDEIKVANDKFNNFVSEYKKKHKLKTPKLKTPKLLTLTDVVRTYTTTEWEAFHGTDEPF